MKIHAKIRYKEEYLPTKRHRIPRIREKEETVEVELREIKKEDTKLALVVTNYKSYLDENGNDQFGLRETPFLAIEELLYTEKKDMWGVLDKGPLSMKDFVREVERHGDCYYSWSGKSKEDVLRSLHEFVDSHMLIDGVLYQQTNEPRYVVNTFGLGHNHGGTGLFIETHYNVNISKDNYFNALQRDEAIAYANKVAAARGDTKSVGTFGDINIQVYMPEMIKCNPQKEHEEGNAFLNSLENMVQGSDNSLEAGLLVMATTAAEVQEKPKNSLSEKIAGAEKRASEALQENKQYENDREQR